MDENDIERLSAFKTDTTNPVILEVQVNGARTRDMNPNVPVTHQEITEELMKCLDAGASMIHAHNTDFFLQGEEAYEDYMKSWAPVIAGYPDVLWYPTTTMSPDTSKMALEHCELLCQKAGLRIGCLDPGFSNLHISEDEDGGLTGGTYGYTPEQIGKQVKMYRENECGIIFGIYEPGYLRTAHYYIRNELAPKGSHIDLYLIGDYGLISTEAVYTAGLPPTMASLYFYLHLMEEFQLTHLPWFLSIWGAGSMDLKPIMGRVIEMGGHLKVGIESHFDPERKPTNLELFTEIKELANEVGRPVATCSQAAGILGV